jgi:glycosyltransferase involved in cell wall biosynthesis
MALVVQEQVGLQRPRISVIIPARNEAQNLAHILPYIPSTVSEVILIGGHSTDDTIAVAEQLLPSIRIVKQMGQGKGDALNGYR